MRRALVALCVLAGGVVSVAAASSAVGAQRPAAGCAQPVAPRVGVDAKGDAVALWLCLRPSMAVQAAVRPAATHTWGAQQNVLRLRAGTYVSDLALAVDAAGDAAAVWRRYSVAGSPTYALSSVVQAAVRPAVTGTWGTAQSLSAAGANAALPQVALDRAGNAVAVWLTNCNDTAEEANCVGRVQAAERPMATGTWSASEDLSAADASAPDAAVDPAGDAVAVWKSGSGFVEAVLRPASTKRWNEPHDLGRAGVPTQPPRVALDGAGNAIVVYTTGTGLQSVARSPATGTWSRPEDLPSAGESYPEFVEVGLAVNPAGEAVAVWRRGSEDAPPAVVQASVRPAVSGGWDAPETLSNATAEAGLPRVALDAVGDGIAVWQDGVRTSPVVCPIGHCTLPVPNVEAAVLSHSSRTWSVANRWKDVAEPQIALDSSGDAVALWVGASKHEDVVEATDRTAATDSWTAPKRVSFAARCTVPTLIGLTLAKAKAALRRDDCKPVRITYAYSQTVKRGHVIAQRPKAGTALEEGASVEVVVSRGRRGRRA